MKIAMMTNTYRPHVGGVAKSVEAFSAEYRKRGHGVLVIAPTFEDQDDSEPDVVRVPAIQNFSGSDFSVRLPVPGIVTPAIEAFRPDILHSHHPFLVGDSAMRNASIHNLPIVFTHHTMYEQYTHYVPVDSPVLKRFVIKLATGYANLCDHVIAPSESVAEILRERGVTTPIAAIPTGIRIDEFRDGDGARIRREYGIPEAALVVGHLGRLAHEKNLGFLTRAVLEFVQSRDDAHFLVVGSGDARENIIRIFREAGCPERLHMTGTLQGQDLVDAYHAMDVFAFASKSETQGMVLAEAMAASLPVVALDAAGAREVVEDGCNGRLLDSEDIDAFARALSEIAALEGDARDSLFKEVDRTAREFSLENTARRTLDLYEDVIERGPAPARELEESVWNQAIGFFKAQWDLLINVATSAGEAISEGGDDTESSSQQ